jgi:ribosomal protein L40E
MESASDSDEIFDEFLARRGHEVESAGWKENYNKKQCPECGGLHDTDATRCTVCDWSPT